MNIGIVEDHAMFLDVIRKLCIDELKHRVSVEANTRKVAVSDIIRAQPDLVILDLALPDGDGFQVLEETQPHCPNTRFLFVSCHCDPFTAHRVCNSQAAGFVDKNSSSFAALQDAINAIAKGGRYFSKAFLDVAMLDLANQYSVTRLLSGKEQEVLRLIAAGLDDEQLSCRLGISRFTAKTHRGRILRKLHLPNTAKLITFAAKNGFGLAGGSDTCQQPVGYE